jgi:hypothetical protein
MAASLWICKMRTSKLVIPIYLCALLAFSVNAEEKNPYSRLEVLDVKSVISTSKGSGCTIYSLQLESDIANKSSFAKRCLANSGDPHFSLWLVDVSKARVVDSYPIFIFVENGNKHRAIKIDTNKTQLEPSKFLSIAIPLNASTPGEHACALSAIGYLEVATYKEHIQDMKKTYIKTNSSIKSPSERKIRELQPWCNDRSAE